jgi:hypothetical protein
MTGLLAEAVFDGLGQVELGLEGVVVQVAVTGSSAAKVRAAALAKLPGGTVDREADTDGSAYDGAVTQDHARHGEAGREPQGGQRRDRSVGLTGLPIRTRPGLDRPDAAAHSRSLRLFLEACSVSSLVWRTPRPPCRT